VYAGQRTRSSAAIGEEGKVRAAREAAGGRWHLHRARSVEVVSSLPVYIDKKYSSFAIDKKNQKAHHPINFL
jgi:hypothetical protein